ncbi:AAA family ATPase [Planococcus maritimus]
MLLKSPYISRIKIKNFRNFIDVDEKLNHKQVIIGENNVGKTNFIKAIQLILDPKLSEDQRFLTDSDFNNTLESPMENGQVIEISIEVQNFEHNHTLLSILSDAVISDGPPTIKLTYRYYPQESERGTDYQYKIFQGDKEEVAFTHFHRKYFNIKVINAIRDVELEMKSINKSPLNKLLSQYDIRKEELEEIADKLKATSEEVLSIDELEHLTSSINSKFTDTIGVKMDSAISLGTIDLDPNRLLNTLKIMLGSQKRPTSNNSLGLNNILYISLILLSLEDKTIPYIIKEDIFNNLLAEEGSEILAECYAQNDKGNFILSEEVSSQDTLTLYQFMEDNNSPNSGFTILAIEEPESHLHPALQRLIFKDVMKQNSSLLMTTHSPYITSVSPLNSMVHLRLSGSGTSIKTTANLSLGDRDTKDLERYIDVKKGEIYFGQGVILVEGVAEEYLIPSFAELLSKPLDKKGIVVCNINSTNFEPFVVFLRALGIPHILITDGDYYFYNEEKEKIFGKMFDDSHELFGNSFDGNERMEKLTTDLNILFAEQISDNHLEQDNLFAENGIFVGKYTLEIDMLEASNGNDKIIFSKVFNELTLGGETQQKNFKVAIDNGKYVEALNKIESSTAKIGKGRFSQGLSTECTVSMIPKYIKNAIEFIYDEVDEL